jgi:Flp pilus assembly protein TadG
VLLADAGELGISGRCWVLVEPVDEWDAASRAAFNRAATAARIAEAVSLGLLAAARGPDAASCGPAPALGSDDAPPSEVTTLPEVLARAVVAVALVNTIDVTVDPTGADAPLAAKPASAEDSVIIGWSTLVFWLCQAHQPPRAMTAAAANIHSFELLVLFCCAVGSALWLARAVSRAVSRAADLLAKSLSSSVTG